MFNKLRRRIMTNVNPDETPSTDVSVQDNPTPVEETQNAPTSTPVEGTSETHVNAFRQDVDDALADAHAALGKAEEAVKALLVKLGV